VYPSRPTALGKLRAYYRGLRSQYREALRRGDIPRARRVYDLRRRVLRAILLREEFCEAR